jgi:ACR3 family arsenite efflux pump ArsB
VALLTGVRLGNRSSLRLAPRTVALACLVNFLAVPVIALLVGYALIPDVDALRVGLLLYCLFPCTDWFLGFIRLAGGDTAIGAALIPVNMAVQLALFPVYLHLLAGTTGSPLQLSAWSALLSWFALPAAVALGLRLSLRRAPRTEAALLRSTDRAVPVTLAALVATIFAANISVLTSHPGAFGRVLVAVFCFLAATWALVWAEQRTVGVAPVSIIAHYGGGFHHPHVRGATVTEWPLNVYTEEHAAAEKHGLDFVGPIAADRLWGKVPIQRAVLALLRVGVGLAEHTTANEFYGIIGGRMVQAMEQENILPDVAGDESGQ